MWLIFHDNFKRQGKLIAYNQRIGKLLDRLIISGILAFALQQVVLFFGQILYFSLHASHLTTASNNPYLY